MKTAMQELIEMYESDLSIIESKRKENDNLRLITEASTLSFVITNLKSKLEKEKEHLEEARLKGYGEGYNEGIYDAENK